MNAWCVAGIFSYVKILSRQCRCCPSVNLTLRAMLYSCRTDVQGGEIHDTFKKRQSDLEHNRYSYNGLRKVTSSNGNIK